MTTPRIEEMVEELARDIESRLVHKLQIETISTKDQSIEYRKGLRDMRYLVMEFTREIAGIPARQVLTEAYQAGIDEAVEKLKLKKQDFTDHLCRFNDTPQKCECYEEALDDTIKALQDNK